MEPKNHLVVKSPLCHNFPQTGEKLNNLQLCRRCLCGKVCVICRKQKLTIQKTHAHVARFNMLISLASCIFKTKGLQTFSHYTHTETQTFTLEYTADETLECACMHTLGYACTRTCTHVPANQRLPLCTMQTHTSTRVDTHMMTSISTKEIDHIYC